MAKIYGLLRADELRGPACGGGTGCNEADSCISQSVCFTGSRPGTCGIGMVLSSRPDGG